MRKPPALREGDAVALIAPAGPLEGPEDLQRACAAVEALGLRPRVGANALERYGYLAGSDAQRAEDFNVAARDPDIRAIFALRGGYGTLRILDLLDYGALRADPKVLLGYSDLTALLNAVSARSDLVTFHGPVAAISPFTPMVVEALRRAICVARPLGTLHVPEMETICGGTARGRLAGGNLSLLAALIGTPYAVDTLGTLLFFEDVDEAPYRIDRMLTQMRLSGGLGVAAGIVAGRFHNCDVPEEARTPGSFGSAQAIDDRLRDLAVPSLRGALIGHIEEQWTIPIGAWATLDADARTLTIEEAAVDR